MTVIQEDDYLMHYGILRKSGRYPWGSGGNQSERNATFLSTINALQKKGMTPAQIADHFAKPGDPKDMWTSTRVIALKAVANEEQKLGRIRRAERLRSEGKSNVEIGKLMGGINESSVRSLLAPGAKEKAKSIENTASMLRDQVAKKGYVDVGAGTHIDLKLKADKLKTAVAKLQEEGYILHYHNVPQATSTSDKKTSLKALGAPGSPWPKDRTLIKPLSDVVAKNGGRDGFDLVQPPISVSSKRIAVKYKEDGGDKADGVLYIRPGKKDLDIGENQYAQVRVMVDKTHFLKGMAVKKANLPDGIDIVFNTNKSNTGNKLDAMKPIKGADEDFFGAMIRQIKDPATGKVTSAMNLVGKKDGAGVEGGWGEWSKSLSSQVLSKQRPSLAKNQLAETFRRSREELDEIKALTNPTLKRKLLEAYADGTDVKAVKLKAAELPGQATHVLLPVNSMKKGEIHAPNYNNGDLVALIRYPHGGTFEIPELVVNNNNPEAKRLLGMARDAVGIHHSVAERLSGADFDGDTVLVIPNHNRTLKSTSPLKGLKDFDPQDYKIPQESLRKDANGNVNDPRLLSKKNTQTEMGKITNLISDMTIKGAGEEDLAKAVRHSMVVIDAEKHGLDYKASFYANGIPALKRHYQGVHEKSGNLKGAATLITRAKSEERVPHRELRKASEGGPINPKTGELVWVPTGKQTSGWNPKTKTIDPSKIKDVTVPSTKLGEARDAHKILSDEKLPIERVYAEHSNRMKALANEARLETLKIYEPSKNPTSARTYKAEVDSLNAKLNVAKSNSPRERQAQIMADAMHKLKLQENPDWTKDDIKKDKARNIAKARVISGADREKVHITPKEWEAIQAGAISKSTFRDILDNTDLDAVKAYATPKTRKVMDTGKVARAHQMLANGATQAEVARQLGVSLTTLKNSLG